MFPFPLRVIAMRCARPLAAAAALAAGVAARAADAPATLSGAAPQAVSPSPLNLALGLLFLLALILGAWWFIRRMGGMAWHGTRACKVVAVLPVGPRERVVLIEIAGRQLLLGVAPGRVNLLHRFDEPVITAEEGGDFATKIRQVMQQGLQR